MQKKESYKHILPHFQQPGQAYFVTWCLLEAVPAKVVHKYSKKLELLKHQIDSFQQENPETSGDGSFLTSRKIQLENKNSRHSKLPASKISKMENVDSKSNTLKDLRKEYYVLRRKYFEAFDKFLDVEAHPKVNLTNPSNLKVMLEALNFWHGKKLTSEAFCVMSNHVHWVFQLFEKDKDGNPVYLQDIMHSVKRYSAYRINKNGDREGVLWQKESFDTTIRNEKHMYNVIEYTLNNPVNAGLVQKREEWPGNWVGDF